MHAVPVPSVRCCRSPPVARRGVAAGHARNRPLDRAARAARARVLRRPQAARSNGRAGDRACEHGPLLYKRVRRRPRAPRGFNPLSKIATPTDPRSVVEHAARTPVAPDAQRTPRIPFPGRLTE
jgi:hypothetical protein